MKLYCVKGIVFLAELVAVFTYDDLSIRKVATQSKTYPGPYDLYKADNAVDRNINTCIRTDMIGPTSPDTTVWWKVDLGGVYNIYSVSILFKNYDGYESRQRGRYAGFSLYVSNSGEKDESSLCYKDGPQLPPLNFTTKCTLSGRYVVFYNERLKDVTYPEGYEITNNVIMEMCEVIVNGCSKLGVYGSNCDILCPINCKYNTCHIQNGTCFGCKPGWTGETCNTKCELGWYGPECKEQCSGHCRENAACNHVTGQCDGGCAAGWRDSFCVNACENGTFGYDCTRTCSGHCLNDSPCNKQTGHCQGGCKPGYTNNFCSENCPAGYFGKECRNKCSEHCFNNKVCAHVDGVCTSGCQDGYIGKWCNTTCPEGRYGQNCSRACSSKCNTTCKQTDGTCSCKAGWRGPNCSIACTRSYGENCQYQCSPLCVNQTCDPFDGTCLPVCQYGTYGGKCNQVIQPSSTRTFGSSNMNEKEMFTVGLSISFGLNAIFIIAALYLLWRRYTKMHPVSAPSCCGESPIYEKSKDVTGQEQTYQELNVQDNPYQNITEK